MKLPAIAGMTIMTMKSMLAPADTTIMATQNMLAPADTNTMTTQNMLAPAGMTIMSMKDMCTRILRLHTAVKSISTYWKTSAVQTAPPKWKKK